MSPPPIKGEAMISGLSGVMASRITHEPHRMPLQIPEWLYERGDDEAKAWMDKMVLWGNLLVHSGRRL